MTGTDDTFTTNVVDSQGRWPSLPGQWSYSSIRDATECPRRWALRRATYPGIWNRSGYPPRPNLPALVGDVIHGSVELLLRSFREHGCTSLADPSTVVAVRSLGGYSNLVEQVAEDRLVRLAGNPRMAARIDGLRATLKTKVPDLRQRVQAIIARTRFHLTPEPQVATGYSPANSQRGPLSPGFHPETELRAEDLHLAGRVDLVTVESDFCEISDYKTGAPDHHHGEQIRFYALLWNRDRELNPHSLPVTRLTLSYSTHDVEVAVPSSADLEMIAGDTSRHIDELESSLVQYPPEARPEKEMCHVCEVRHLCEEYWTEIANSQRHATSEPEPDWFDLEGQIVGQNGPRSWLIKMRTEEVVLLRTSSESVPFQSGDSLRILDLRREDGEELTQRIGIMTQTSEIFALRS